MKKHLVDTILVVLVEAAKNAVVVTVENVAAEYVLANMHSLKKWEITFSLFYFMYTYINKFMHFLYFST